MFNDAGPSESRRRFENAVAVITGGSKGIGLAIASRLAREGACTAINASGAVAFLLSEDALYVTGSDLVVDGGRLLVGGETVDLIGVHDPERIQEHLDAVGRAFAAQTEGLKAGPGEGGQ